MIKKCFYNVKCVKIMFFLILLLLYFEFYQKSCNFAAVFGNSESFDDVIRSVISAVGI